MEKLRRPNLPSHRRLESLDMKKSSFSLNVSSSSLRSISEDREATADVVPAGRRSAAVKFAPTPPPPSSAAARRRSSIVVSPQAPKARPPTARPASSSGPKARSSSSSASSLLPQSRPRAIRRSWGVGEKEVVENGDLSAAATKVRSCSVTRRTPAEEKSLQKRESESKIIYRAKGKSDPLVKPDVPNKAIAQRSPNIARKTCEKAAPSRVSLDKMIKGSPPRKTSAMTEGTSWEGTSWESLPSDLQSLGLEVMSYRDAAEMAAIEALQEASAAEILLRCLSAFAELAASAPKQSPQQTVDEFLALQATVTRSGAVHGDQEQRGHAGDWLQAAVTSDLAPFSVYTAPGSSRKSSTASPTVSSWRPVEEITWLETAVRELGEELCAWFVRYVDQLLDDDVAGTLGQLKRVNGWLDAVVVRSEALERLRKKIFGYLLDQVESAAVALNGAGVGVAPNRRK